MKNLLFYNCKLYYTDGVSEIEVSTNPIATTGLIILPLLESILFINKMIKSM